MEYPHSHCVQQFYIRISFPYLSVVGIETDFYGQLPITLGNILGQCKTCNSKKLHLKTFFTQCTQKFLKQSKRRKYFLCRQVRKGSQKRSHPRNYYREKAYCAKRNLNFPKRFLWLIQGEVERYTINFVKKKKKNLHPAT